MLIYLQNIFFVIKIRDLQLLKLDYIDHFTIKY